MSISVVVLAAVGCSSDEPKQEFSVPKALCGISVPTDALSDLLPASGTHLSVEHTGSLDAGSTVCAVKVDADTVLDVSGERIETGDSARNVLRSRLSIQQQKSADNSSIAYTDHAAASLIKCGGAHVQEGDISTLIKILKPARPGESAMKKLIQGYTDSLKEQAPCKSKS